MSGVVLLAAGSSQRFGRAVPKQFLLLNKEPLFLKSLRVFLRVSSVQEIVVVTRQEDIFAVQRWLRRVKSNKKISVVRGGVYRGESVKQGYEALVLSHRVILIHDAARPLVSSDIIRRVEKAAQKTGVALAAWPLPDTLKKTQGDRVQKTIPRKNLWLAQTPQGFRSEIAEKCLRNPSPHVTDDVELAERKGFRVKIVEGSAENFKITYSHDWKLCQKLSR